MNSNFRVRENRAKSAQSFTDVYSKKLSQLRESAKKAIQRPLSCSHGRNRFKKRHLHFSGQSGIKEHSILISKFVNAQKKASYNKCRMLIDKKNPSQGHSKPNQPNKIKYKREKTYHQIYNQFEKDLKHSNVDYSPVQNESYDENVKTIESLKAEKLMIDQKISTIMTQSEIFKEVIQDKLCFQMDQGMLSQYQLLASKTIPEMKETPGQLIYQDYNLMKQKQLESVQSKFNRFHNEQRKIFQRLTQKGVSEENQNRMISKVYQIYQLLNGRIKQSDKQQSAATNFKNIRKRKFSQNK